VVLLHSLKNVSAGVALTVYQISGNFINGEKLIFDRTNDTRVSIGFSNYGISDVKSLYANVGASKTFLQILFSQYQV
jgi:hypothetical protein